MTAQPPQSPKRTTTFAEWLDTLAPSVFIWPSVLIILLLAIFPLFVSLYLSFAQVNLVSGGYEVKFVGWKNYEKIFQGSQQRNFFGRWSDELNFLGLPGSPDWIGWVVMALLTVFLAVMLVSHLRRRQYQPIKLIGGIIGTVALTAVVRVFTVWLVAPSGAMAGTWFEEQYWLSILLPVLTAVGSANVLGIDGLFWRVVTIGFTLALAYLFAITFGADGLPGATVVTLVFVFGGITAQYVIGLGLALLVTQNLPGKRFFRIIFLLPMLITPVGVGFLFRMMADTLLGPLSPLWQLAGLSNYSWVETANGARLAILITDTWQWTPFMFIILLAALEGVSTEPIEAGLVDGANRWQLFRFVVLPEIVPVSVTLLLIRMIEAFKIIDLPRIMTRGGPGTATESITLYAFNQWKASTSSIGFSSASAYLLLLLVTFCALVLVNIVRRRVLEAFA
ncbi:MAG: ABC transporter permease subunit [Phototrophicaceae bacterium]